MKKYYISSKYGHSGICKYSYDFYELVLKEKGYIFIDSGEDHKAIFETISCTDQVHIEVGIFQKKEIAILLAMLDAGFTNVAVTLHDAPLLKYPFTEFKSSFLNNASKFYDIYINKFSASALYINKIKNIYVLSRKGMEAIKSTYKIQHVYFLPHVIDETEIKQTDLCYNNNFIYFGFIGKNKGIEYSLQLHQSLLVNHPEINFYIVGRAMGKEKLFYNYLKEKYTKNVHFLGYVPDDKLDEVFNKASFALMPFKPYKFFSPFSGSILYNLKKGKIIFTNNVNAISEIIEDERNGFFISGDVDKDSKTISAILNDKDKLATVSKGIKAYLLQNHTVTAVCKNLKD